MDVAVGTLGTDSPTFGQHVAIGIILCRENKKTGSFIPREGIWTWNFSVLSLKQRSLFYKCD